MQARFTYGAVQESRRQAIFVVRVHDALLDLLNIEDVAGQMRERLARRGEINADVVVVQGDAKETLRLFGLPHSVARVRAAMFNATISWTPVDLEG